MGTPCPSVPLSRLMEFFMGDSYQNLVIECKFERHRAIMDSNTPLPLYSS
jgi:hypothetical protein